MNLTFSFDDGETANLSVPVVVDDEQWTGLDTFTPSPSQSPSESPSESPSDSSS